MYNSKQEKDISFNNLKDFSDGTHSQKIENLNKENLCWDKSGVIYVHVTVNLNLLPFFVCAYVKTLIFVVAKNVDETPLVWTKAFEHLHRGKI